MRTFADFTDDFFTTGDRFPAFQLAEWCWHKPIWVGVPICLIGFFPAVVLGALLFFYGLVRYWGK